MKWTGLNELREKYLSFFESKGHTRLKSYPLIPQGDNSLLLINSGMAPLKKYFLGQETPPNVRVTTCQKCIRTPDIERVGKTSRHGTYFEMLGNFSFGDYFKHEATAWAWEFVTKVLELPVDRIWISIYQDDDEAFEIWTKEVGIDPTHIVRLGKEDNFWEHGVGPCGPCSELYFDRGEDVGCGSPDCAVGCDCDRFVEFWNLVFTQFDSDGNGNYARMPKPNIDTGMGLERLACIMQGVDNLFEVDTVANIMKHIAKIANVTYKENEKVDVSLRVITDHIRSTTFMVGDGVLPSNEGRGYVLRRLLRRAARHGRLLGIKKPFLFEVVDTVINENKSAYPELAEKAVYIKKVISIEEESFAKTVDKGMELLTEVIEKAQKEGAKVISGEDAFKLNDTFGFPLDLTKEIVEEKGLVVDEDAFNALMTEQKKRAREARSNNDAFGASDDTFSFLSGNGTKFVGYETLTCDAKVEAIVANGEKADFASAGSEVAIVLDTTPFYAESGGQLGDKGVIEADDCKVEITDTKKISNGYFIHIGKVLSGELKQDQNVTAKVNATTRMATVRNHTSAHLVQAALRSILGDHVHQAGQQVDENRMRFDFTHFSAMTQDELQQLEDKVNEVIAAAIDVEVSEKSIDEAKKMGAMALFGEKYGDVVRVCKIGDVSLELCGGTHIKNTALIGCFKIVSETSVASGVRRIEAVTGFGVLEMLNDAKALIAKSAEALKLANENELANKCASMVSELKEKDRQIEKLNAQIANSKIESLFDNAKQVGAVSVVTAKFEGTSSDALRSMGDMIKDRDEKIVAVISSVTDGKGTFLCVCGKKALDSKLHAGKIIQQIAAIAGGKGGGRPDSAMAGVSDVSKIDEALSQVTNVVEGFMNN